MQIVSSHLIHRITVHSAACAPARHARAACPRNAEGVDVDACSSCAFSRGFVGPPGDRRAVVCLTEPVDGASGTVAALMTRDVTCVRDDLDVDSVAWLVGHEHKGTLPVVDAERRPLGVVAKADLVRALGEGRLRADGAADSCDSFDATDAAPKPCRTASDVMSAPVVAVSALANVADAAALFVEHRIHGAPVVGEDGRVVGVLTSLDLLRALALPFDASAIGDPR